MSVTTEAAQKAQLALRERLHGACVLCGATQPHGLRLDFHVHENSDELFCVLEGSYTLELADGAVELSQGDLM